MKGKRKREREREREKVKEKEKEKERQREPDRQTEKERERVSWKKKGNVQLITSSAFFPTQHGWHSGCGSQRPTHSNCLSSDNYSLSHCTIQ